MRVIIFTILLGFALSCQSSDQEPLALTYSISSLNPLNESEQAILKTALSDRFEEFGFPKTELEIGPEKVSVLACFNQNRPGKKELFYKLFDSYELDF